MKLSKEEYAARVEKAAKPTRRLATLLPAFLVGGTICTLGEGLLNLYGFFGLNETDAGTLTAVTLIAFTALLTGLSFFHVIARYAGAGTLVPITGFANAMASPALEFKSEGFVLGLGAKMFVIAGPVLVYGLSASVVYGIVYWVVETYL